MSQLIGTDKVASCGLIVRNLRSALSGIDPNLPSSEGLLVLVQQVWDGYGYYASVGPYLQYGFTARQAIDNVLSGVWPIVDAEEAGIMEKRGQMFAQLHSLRDDLTAEIDRLLAQARASYLPVMGVMGQGQLGSAPAADIPRTLSAWGFPLGDFGTLTPGPFGSFGWGW